MLISWLPILSWEKLQQKGKNAVVQMGRKVVFPSFYSILCVADSPFSLFLPLLPTQLAEFKTRFLTTVKTLLMYVTQKIAER